MPVSLTTSSACALASERAALVDDTCNHDETLQMMALPDSESDSDRRFNKDETYGLKV